MVQENLKLMIVGIIFVSVLPGVIEFIRHKRGEAGTRRSVTVQKVTPRFDHFFIQSFGLLCFNVQHSWSVGGKNGIMRPQR